MFPPLRLCCASAAQRTPDFHECAVKAIASLHCYAELRIAEAEAEAEKRGLGMRKLHKHVDLCCPAECAALAPGC